MVAGAVVSCVCVVAKPCSCNCEAVFCENFFASVVFRKMSTCPVCVGAAWVRGVPFSCASLIMVFVVSVCVSVVVGFNRRKKSFILAPGRVRKIK